MELEVTEEFDPEEAEDSIQTILESNRLCSLATVDRKDSRPHIATAFFVFDQNFNFYILTESETEHGQHLEENSSIALSIYDSHQEWSNEKKGLQVFGEAGKVEERKVPEVLERYLESFPDLEQFASDREELKELDSGFYKIMPERIKIFDEPRFGKETWVNVKFQD